MTGGTAKGEPQKQANALCTNKFLVAKSLLKELAAQKRKGHEMKKLLVLITLVLFSAGALTEAFAAPARNARAGSGAKATQKRVVAPQATRQARAKAANKKRTRQAKAKSTLKLENSEVTAFKEGQRGKEEQMGLMPSELDYLNHNVFHADAAAIRGARDTESALRYIPFVTITNTAGFGQSFDLRGQGRLAANGVKLYINGVPATPLDTYYMPMPINTLLPQLIQEIEVFPGSGAVLYGSGTKGGTINVITSKRQNPYFLVGGGYVNTVSSKGNSFNAFAQAAENLGFANVNAGLGASVLGGPREDDSFLGGQAVLGATVPLGLGQQLDIDLDFFYGKTKTTPYNSFMDSEAIEQAILTTPFLQSDWAVANRQINALAVPSFEPDKTTRSIKGDGEIETTTLRGTGVVGYTSDLATRLQFNADAFASYESIKFDKYAINVPYFVLGSYVPKELGGRGKSYSWYLPHPDPDNERLNFVDSDNANPDWNYLEQNGSTFTEMKFGAKTEINWKHQNGFLVFGLTGQYEMGKRNPKQYLRAALPFRDGYSKGGVGLTLTGPNGITAQRAWIDNKLDTNVITAGVYAVEKYDFNPQFSIMAGARYEMKNYSVKAEDKFESYSKRWCGNCKNEDGSNTVIQGTTYGSSTDSSAIQNNGLVAQGAGQTIHKSDPNDPRNNPTGEYNKNYDNFVGEIAPVFKYSQTGAIYARGELGYIAPPAWAMLSRVGSIDFGNNNNINDPSVYNMKYYDSELESEIYYTAELGWKEIIGRRIIPVGFMDIDITGIILSASVFYTDSQNEFYFEGDSYSGMSFGNYAKSRRMGAEVALEQILFNGLISFNESFMYLKAEKFDCLTRDDGTLSGACVDEEKWDTMPYTYDYKATLGASVDISGYLEIIDVGVAVWLQNSLYGNQIVPVKTLRAYQQALGAPTYYELDSVTSEKLKPYLISDFGLTVSINKGMGTVTAGVKNVFDTFYYDYYNNDKTAVVSENRYVIGRGRTVFVEGTFKY